MSASKILSVTTTVRLIANGAVGQVDVCHGNYCHTSTDEIYFESVEEASRVLSAMASNPAKIMEDYPTTSNDF